MTYLERRDGAHADSTWSNVSAGRQIFRTSLTARSESFTTNILVRSLTGSSWFVVHAARLDLPGAVGTFRVLVNSDDITLSRQTEETLRDLGGRLITAQEEERSRVARELHDDLNQRMALLSVELEQLSQRMPQNKRTCAPLFTTSGKGPRRFLLRSTGCRISFTLPNWTTWDW